MLHDAPVWFSFTRTTCMLHDAPVWFSFTRSIDYKVLPRADRCPECSELRREPIEADLHHSIIHDGHIDGGEGVADLLHSGGIINHRLFLPDIVELLSELQLLGHCATSKNLFEICPRICETVHYSVCRLFPGQKVPMCRIHGCLICSFDLTPVSVPKQIQVHLVRPRCIVAPIELLRWK